MRSGFFEVEMIDPRKAAQEQAEASFNGFITDSQYGLYGLIAFLLAVGAYNFSVQNDSFPAYNGVHFSRYNLN